MLLGATDRQIRMIERFVGCFTDYHEAYWDGGGYLQTRAGYFANRQSYRG
jgi:hypothetical protein